jgi:hypothetical protein
MRFLPPPLTIKPPSPASLSPDTQPSSATAAPDPERSLKDAGGCALAVAVLSAFVRLPGVAADPAVMGLAPALVKVSGNGGGVDGWMGPAAAAAAAACFKKKQAKSRDAMRARARAPCCATRAPAWGWTASSLPTLPHARSL